MSNQKIELEKEPIFYQPGGLVERRNYRLEMTLLMVVADLLSFILTVGMLLTLNALFAWFEITRVVVNMLILEGVASLLFVTSGLYPGVGINPAEELKRVSQSVSIAFGIGLLVSIFFQPGSRWFFISFFIAWMIHILACVVLRWGFRIEAAKRGGWGEPVAILGDLESASRTARFFSQRRHLGYIPLFIVSIQDIQQGKVERWKGISSKHAGRREEVETLLVDISAVTELAEHRQQLADFLANFKRMILVTDTRWLGGVSLGTLGFEGMVGLEACRNSLSVWRQFLKRSVDIMMGGGLLLLASPLVLLAGLLVKVVSRGPAFYVQTRVGQNGKPFAVYKLRTMVVDAEKALSSYLQSNPQAQLEWAQTQKLKHDPRIFPLGGWIRTLSIDELPQLLNVLKGEMSLVGPRPLPGYHHDLLSETGKALRVSISPGLTGLWQVSGRSNLTVEDMETLDVYYIHNWSLWLDIYILLRTVWVVLSRDGGY